MIIFVWFVSVILFLVTGVILLSILTKDPRQREAIVTFVNGIKEGLRGCGFNINKRKYPVDLYIWEVLDEESVSDECLDRTTWPAMDIADWISEGLPGTPEAEDFCQGGKNCRCRLVRFNPRKVSHKKYR